MQTIRNEKYVKKIYEQEEIIKEAKPQGPRSRLRINMSKYKEIQFLWRITRRNRNERAQKHKNTNMNIYIHIYAEIKRGRRTNRRVEVSEAEIGEWRGVSEAL